MYYELDGQLQEIKRQLRQPNGYPFDPAQLKLHLQVAVEGRFEVVSGNFRLDKRKDGWTLLENSARRISSAINGISFLKKDEGCVNGEELIRRARTELNANYGQEDAEWLLENQDKIPAELRKYYLVFPGTIWRSRRVYQFVQCLFWRGDRWSPGFRWLGYGWFSDGRLVVPRK
ncbi:MAG: hypothetical protein HYT65_01460 [Candidatus Yanofskybacteria bacterium]|nr:hypothetical protein [Candidatus Yanofskybacteria bacterium]